MLSKSEEETKNIGKKIGRQLNKGDIVALFGEFGAGKTVLIKGIAKGIGCNEKIKSPSFNYVYEYKGPLPIYHIDLYRVNSIKDILTLGIQEFLTGEGICLIEWAEKIEDMLPNNAVRVTMKIIDETTREIEIREMQSLK